MLVPGIYVGSSAASANGKETSHIAIFLMKAFAEAFLLLLQTFHPHRSIVRLRREGLSQTQKAFSFRKSHLGSHERVIL